jgi:type I restriction enzyme M protein
MLVENYLFAVVSLPTGIFKPYAGVKTNILFIDRQYNGPRKLDRGIR